MSEGIVIHLDDNPETLKASQSLFAQQVKGLELIACCNKEEFDSAIKIHEKNLRCIIFDLLGAKPKKEEIIGNEGGFLQQIIDSFALRNIPIFIFSGYLEKIEDKYGDCGTVFKVDKGNGDLADIFNRIQLFHESGFFDVFCKGGILEKEINKDMHKAFTGQFRNDEIEKIIQSVRNSNPDGCRERCIGIFKRIAVRALMSQLLAPIDNYGETVNPTEHYYRRITESDFWTGDVYNKKDNSETIIILTPRCDLTQRKANDLLVCVIEMTEPQIGEKRKDKQIENASKILTDNNQGKTCRWLPSSPVFDGGKVQLSNYKTIPQNTLKENYTRIITLSDELTNELLGKFSSCFLRTGISEIDPIEFIACLQLLKEASDGQSKLDKR